MALDLFETKDGFSLVFDLEKRLIIISPWAYPTFFFLLEHVPAGPCGCVLGNHKVMAITDITLSFHHFLAGGLSSSTDWANTPTRILVLLREHGWGDSKSRIIVFSSSTSLRRKRSHGATPSSLSDRVPSSPAGLPPWGQAHHILWPQNLLSVEGLFICWENKFSSWTPSSPLECFSEGP